MSSSHLSGYRTRTMTLTASSLMLAAASFVSCAKTQDSETKDIFKEDIGDQSTGNARRHPATAEEKLWTINMSGCTGHLISPDYLMSANHCSPRAGARYKSGYSDAKGLKSDIAVTELVESSAALDFAIMKITWTNGYPKDQKFPPLIATKSSDVNFSRDTGSGDELFTVGYPQDKFNSWGATYAEGRAKVMSGNRFYYDIGIINGNSGGGVWRKSDKMLVSLTNGGAHAFGQAGWDNANISSSSNWNFGPPIWSVYESSKILKDIFPEGKNRFAKTSDGPKKDILVMIGNADNSGADTYTLYFSAPATSSALYFCNVSDVASCDSSATGYTRAVAVKTMDGRSFFQASSSTALSNNMPLAIVATDNSNAKIAVKSVKFEAK